MLTCSTMFFFTKNKKLLSSISILVVFMLTCRAEAAGLNTVEWRFLSGSSTAHETGQCGTAGQFSTGYTPGARYRFSMTTAYNGRFYLFGGFGIAVGGSAGDLGDVWVHRHNCWSCKGEWAWIGGSSSTVGYYSQYGAPTPYIGGRYFTAVWFKPPNQLYFHGGYGKDVASATGELSELWSFNTDTYDWTWLKGSSLRRQVAVYGTKGTPAAGNVPGSVNRHLLLTSKSNDTGIIFGGKGLDSSTSISYLADTWKYTSGTTQWTWINGPGLIDQNSIGGSSGVYSSTYFPGGREKAAVMDTTHRAGSDYVYQYGGLGRSSSSFGYLADLWAYNTVTNEWAYVTGESSSVNGAVVASYGTLGQFSGTNHPASRSNTAGCSDPNSDLVMVFGGSDTDLAWYIGDFWAFNTTTLQWAWASGDATEQDGNYADYVWFSSSNKPGARRSHEVTVDHDFGLMYLFGGLHRDANKYNDFWATKGPTVVIGVSPTGAPSPTVVPTPTPIPTPTPTPLCPVEWTWLSGATTTNTVGVCGTSGQFSTQYSPGGRFKSAMTTAYNNNIYLFGGEGYATAGGLGYVGDVWAYRQACWSCKGEWAWLGGKSDSVYYQGYYDGSTPYPGSRSASVIWFTPPSQLHIHGGLGYDGSGDSGYLSDLWSFNTDTFVWTFLKGSSIRNPVAVFGTKGTPTAGNIPGSGALHMLLTSKSDGTAIIFGGTGYDATAIGPLSDTWKYTNGTTQWTWINGPGLKIQFSTGGSSGVYSSIYYPGGRDSCAVMDTSHRIDSDMVYMFGGMGYSSSAGPGRLPDLWAYDTVTNEWAYIAGESSAINTDLLGSYGSLGFFNASIHPGTRNLVAGYSDLNSDLIMLFGGSGFGATTNIGRLNDFWAFNTTTKQWAWASGDSVVNQYSIYADSVWFSSSNKPSSRKAQAACVNNDFGLMYLFGGNGYTASEYGRLNDFWATKGPTVAIPTPSPTPSPSPEPSPVPILKPVEWRWLSGVSTGAQLSVNGVAGQYGASFTPGSRKEHKLAISDNHIYLFGGLGYNAISGFADLGDVWVYSQTEWSSLGQWAWLGGKSNALGYQGYYNGPTPYPGARRGGLVWFARPNLLHVHGGYGRDGNNALNRLSDLWSFNTDTYVWTYLKGSSNHSQLAVYGTKGIPAAGNAPGAIYSDMLLTSKSDGTAIIFGGGGCDSSGFGFISDSWKHNNSTNEWTWVNGPGIASVLSVGGSSGVYSSAYFPGSRASSTVMDGTHLSYLYGGIGNSKTAYGRLADLWTYNTVTNEWAYITGESSAIGVNTLGSFGSLGSFSDTNERGNRQAGVGYSDPNSDLLLLFGGYGFDIPTTAEGRFNDFWAFNITTKQWSWASGDSVIDQNGIYANSVWFSSANNPGARSVPAAAVNHELGVMYVIGGYGRSASSSAYLNDMWATKGPTVAVGVSPTNTPSPTTSPTASPTPSPGPILKPIEWRLMSGASDVNQNGVCGTAGQYSTGYTPGSRTYGTMTIADGGHLYLFGGSGYHTEGGAGGLGDVWVYRQTCWSCKGEWAWLGGKFNEMNYQGYYAGSTPYPGSRSGPIAWFTPPNHVHVHGGDGRDGLNAAGKLSDLWSFNTDTYTWTFLKGSSVANQVAVYGTKGTPAAGNVPGANYFHMLLTSKSDGTVIMFGGGGYDAATSGHLADTWKYTNDTIQWTWINGPSVRNQRSVGGSSGTYSSTYYPGGRYACAVIDTTHRTDSYLAYLFGGNGHSQNRDDNLLADLWAFNTITGEWAFVAGEFYSVGDDALGVYGSQGFFASSNHPGSRQNSMGYSDPNSDFIMVFGGNGYGLTASVGNRNDLFVFNITTKQWSWGYGGNYINYNGVYTDSLWFSSSNKPGARKGSPTSVNHELGLMYVLGGAGYGAGGGGNLNDFWATKGPAIIVGVSPTASPTTSPTASPTVSPTVSPTTSPTMSPTVSPTTSPTASPTVSPTASPTTSPTTSPTVSPTVSPTTSPTMSPTVSPTTSPTMSPTVSPTASPTTSPTMSPTVSPTTSPTTSPTVSPTTSPTVSPTWNPNVPTPTMSPTISPTTSPTATPTASPTASPTWDPAVPTPTTSPTATTPWNPTPTAVSGGGFGSSSGDNGGMDEVVVYIIIAGGAILGTVVVAFFIMATTKRGRRALGQLIGKNGRKKGHTVIKVSKKSTNSKPSGENVKDTQQPIIQIVQNYNYVVNSNNDSQLDSQYGVCQYTQEAVDPSQLQAIQGDVIYIERRDGSGWLFGTVVDNSGQKLQNGWYPEGWVQPIQNPFGQETTLDEDEMPLKSMK